MNLLNSIVSSKIHNAQHDHNPELNILERFHYSYILKCHVYLSW